MPDQEHHRDADRTDRPDGRHPDRPDGRVPRVPDGRLPDRSDGRSPDRPDGRLPDGRVPDGRLPDGRSPDRPAGHPHPPLWPVRLLPVPIEPDPAVAAAWQPGLRPLPAATPLPPDLLLNPVPTQGTARLLATLGLSETEAARLISYVVGLPDGKSAWTLEQIDRLLLLREMYQGPWGEVERRPAG
jgi:hypothetical protein